MFALMIDGFYMSSELLACSDLLPFTHAEEGVLRACLYAVAAAETEPSDLRAWRILEGRARDDAHLAVVPNSERVDYLSSLRLRTGAWRSQLWSWAQVEGLRRGLVAFVTCTASDLVEETQLLSARSVLRMNAVLDVLDVSYQAQDLQATYDEVAASLSAATVSPGFRKAVTGGKYAVAGVAGFHGVTGAGVAGVIDQAGNYLTGQSERWDASVESKAALVICCLAVAEDGPHASVRDVLIHLSDELGQVSRDANRMRRSLISLPTDASADSQRRRIAGQLKSLERELRVLRTTVEWITPAPGSAPSSADVTLETAAVPDLSGLDLPDARRMVEACGFCVKTEDATSMGRSVRSEKNWRVMRSDPCAGEERGPGATVVLKVSKPG